MSEKEDFPLEISLYVEIDMRFVEMFFKDNETYSTSHSLVPKKPYLKWFFNGKFD